MHISRSNVLCLIVGAAVGVGAFSILSGSKDLKAAPQSDRTKKFTMSVAPADELGQTQAVFAIDFLQGQIVGGIINNQTGKYTHKYFRQLNADFGLDPNTPEPEYAIVGCRANLAGNNMSKGILHVGEKSSGRIIAYAFSYSTRPPARVQPLTPLDTLQFRQQ